MNWSVSALHVCTLCFVLTRRQGDRDRYATKKLLNVKKICLVRLPEIRGSNLLLIFYSGVVLLVGNYQGHYGREKHFSPDSSLQGDSLACIVGTALVSD